MRCANRIRCLVFRRARKGPACLRRGREVGGGGESATTSDAETRYRTVLQVCLLVSGALTSSSSRTHSLFCPVHLRGSLDADGLATWGGASSSGHVTGRATARPCVAEPGGIRFGRSRKRRREWTTRKAKARGKNQGRTENPWMAHLPSRSVREGGGPVHSRPRETATDTPPPHAHLTERGGEGGKWDVGPATASRADDRWGPRAPLLHSAAGSGSGPKAKTEGKVKPAAARTASWYRPQWRRPPRRPRAFDTFACLSACPT
jgi:hypothetical protein